MTDLDDPCAGRERAALREAFRRHEHLADGAGQRLLPAVQDRLGRSHARPQWVVVAALVVLAAGAVPAVFALAAHRGGVPPQPGAATQAPTDAPTGWRWESSLGVEVLVPESWSVNDFGCHQTSAPSVVRALGPQEHCFTAEPPDKELVILGRADFPLDAGSLATAAGLAAGAVRTEVSVDGHDGVRSVGRRSDGRPAAVVVIADRGVSLIVRVRSEQTLATILDSLRIVEVDHTGCPAPRPEISASWPDGRLAAGASLADGAWDSVAVCYYRGVERLRQSWRDLGASVQLRGESAQPLLSLLATAPVVGGPPSGCPTLQPVAATPAALLLLRRGDLVRPIWVFFDGCTVGGLTDGEREWQLNQRIIAALMAPLHSGYAFNPGLPH